MDKLLEFLEGKLSESTRQINKLRFIKDLDEIDAKINDEEKAYYEGMFSAYAIIKQWVKTHG